MSIEPSITFICAKTLKEDARCTCPMCKLKEEVERLRGEKEEEYGKGYLNGAAKQRKAREAAEAKLAEAKRCLGEARETDEQQIEEIQRLRAEAQRLRAALEECIVELALCYNNTHHPAVMKFRQAIKTEEG